MGKNEINVSQRVDQSTHGSKSNAVKIAIIAAIIAAFAIVAAGYFGFNIKIDDSGVEVEQTDVG